ncbi:MAG TPA: cupin domain-containing protein, partial [Kineosporiaceae bacterium]
RSAAWAEWLARRTAARTAARTAGQTGARTAGQTGARTAGQTGARTAGQTGARTAGQTGARTAARTAEQTVGEVTDLGLPRNRDDGQAGASGRPALRRCTHLEPERFAAEIWGRQASLSPAELLPRGFGDLLDADAVDTLISRRGLRTPFLRVVRDGRTLPEARFTRSGGAGAGIGDQVDDGALARLFADGSTIVLQGLHRTHDPVLEFAQALAGELGHPVQANAYVTPPQSRGFGAHYDVHDVFVLQVAGMKRWIIHDPVLSHPRRDQPWTDRRPAVEAAATTAPLLDVVLRPGDALYLPAGFLHAAESLGDTSIHLTAGVHTWTRAHLVAALVARLADVAELREPLPLGVDVAAAASIEPALRAVVEAVRAAAGRTAAADLVGDLAGQAATASRPAPVGPLAQARALAALHPGSRLRRRPGLAATLLPVDAGPGGPPRLLLRTPELTVTLPAAAAGAVRRLLAGEVLAVADLGPGDDVLMTDAERMDVAHTLVRHALVVTA